MITKIDDKIIGRKVILVAVGDDAALDYDKTTGTIERIEGKYIKIRVEYCPRDISSGSMLSFKISSNGWSYRFLDSDWDEESNL